MSNEFRHLLILYVVSAVLIFGGFYLTSIPPIFQIILLVIGLGFTIYTLIKLTKVLVKQFKNG